MASKEISINGGLNKYEIVDFLKGFSILTIVLMHFIQMYIQNVPSVLSKISSLGGTGVHVFVFLSGFGLYYSNLKHALSFKEFLQRRFIKIYVPYIFIIMLSAMLPFMYDGDSRLEALLSHIFLYKMFIPQYECSFGVQMWYISTLFQLYLLFIPLCKLINKIKRKKFFLITLGVSCTWWIFLVCTGLNEMRIWNSFCLQFLWEYALGMCVADILYKKSKIILNKKVIAFIALLGLGIQAFMVKIGDGAECFNDVPALLGYASLAISIYGLGITFINKLCLMLSKISYEWYLTHILVFSSINYLCKIIEINSIIIALVSVPFSVMFAILYKKVSKEIQIQLGV